MECTRDCHALSGARGGNLSCDVELAYCLVVVLRNIDGKIQLCRKHDLGYCRDIHLRHLHASLVAGVEWTLHMGLQFVRCTTGPIIVSGVGHWIRVRTCMIYAMYVYKLFFKF